MEFYMVDMGIFRDLCFVKGNIIRGYIKYLRNICRSFES